MTEAERERAAVVRWLRAEENEAVASADAQSDHTNSTWEIGRALGLEQAADAIERGDHLAPEEG